MNEILLASSVFVATIIGWFKDNEVRVKTIYYTFLFPLLVIILITLPIGITYMGKEILNLKSNSLRIIGSADGWLSFLGGCFGGIIALGGVYWQVIRKETKERKQKEDNITTYARFTFKKIKESDFFYKIHSELGLFHKNSYSLEPLNPLDNFNQEYFNSNTNTILCTENGETILDISDRVYKCSKLFNSLIMSNRTQVEHKIASSITLLISKVDDDEIKIIEEIAYLNQSIVLFSNILQLYNNDNQKYTSQLVHNFMGTMSKTNMIKRKYTSIINQLTNKNRDVSTSLEALNLLLEMMREMMTLIDNIRLKKRPEKVETDLEAQKIINDLGEISVEIFKLHDLYSNLSNESHQILKKFIFLLK